MAEAHGKDAVFKIDNSAGSLTDMTAFVTSVSHGRTGETHDITTFGNSWREFLAGLKDGGEVTIEGNFDAASGASHDVFKATVAETRSVEILPLGSGTGDPLIQFESIGTNYGFSPAVDDKISFTCTVKVTGAITDAVNP